MNVAIRRVLPVYAFFRLPLRVFLLKKEESPLYYWYLVRFAKPKKQHMANPTQLPGVWHDGIAIVRIVVGIMLIFHGWQVFEEQEMQGFRDLFLGMSMPFPAAMPYVGKVIEIGCGMLLILGLFTRLVTALLFITFMFITFIIGDGRIFAENQLPFLFALVSLLFFFTGSGRLSVDFVVFANRKEDKKDAGTAVSKQFGRYVSKN